MFLLSNNPGPMCLQIQRAVVRGRFRPGCPLGVSFPPQPPAFLRPLRTPKSLGKQILFKSWFNSFFGVQETYVTHGFQLTIKVGEQEYKRKHVYVQLALLQRCGLDVSDLFSTITRWPSPNFSPSSFVGPAAGWRSCLRTPIPLLGPPKSSGLLVTIIKMPREGRGVADLHAGGGGKVPKCCGMVHLQAFAVLFSFRQVIPTPGPQFLHFLNGCAPSGEGVPGVPCTWTLIFLPACFGPS